MGKQKYILNCLISHQEVEVIEGVRSVLVRTLEQTVEQIRRLRSAKYFLQKDVADKNAAISIDNSCHNLNNKDTDINLYEGVTQDLVKLVILHIFVICSFFMIRSNTIKIVILVKDCSQRSLASTIHIKFHISVGIQYSGFDSGHLILYNFSHMQELELDSKEYVLRH